ncbi:MAG: AbrB family transcriptional regulator [Hyphomicrobiales bacterium]|nr:AbrB family transcriptional regulator [Hyphomicrobiales bacterium]
MTRPDPSRLALPPLAGQLLTIAGAAAGGALVNALGVPAGWLSGGMIATALMAALRIAEPLSTPFRWAAMAFSGVAIGSAVTPAMMKSVAAYPASIALMACAVIASTWACSVILSHVRGWSRATAFFASVPGALSYVFSIAAEMEDVDLSRVAIVQVLRVFLLMGFVPLVVAESGVARGAINYVVDPLPTLAVLLLAGVALGALLERMRVAGGMLFGGMLASGLAHALELAPGRPPQSVALVAQILIGAWVGVRFIGFDWGLFGRSAVAAVGSFLVAIGISAAFSYGAMLALHVPFAQTLLAFSPGGLEAMTLLAFAMGLDPLFVGAHHLARFFLISFTLPFALKMWIRGAHKHAADGKPR